MFEATAILYKDGERTYDNYLNEHISRSSREILVERRGVYRSEFYNAAQAGLHPTITLFVTNREDYEGETLVEFEGKRYDVIRTDWDANGDGISLILQEKTNEEH